MTVSNEKEDLTNLVKSPGWLRVRDWAAQEWNAKVGQGIESAANISDDVAALHRLRQIIAAKNSVELVLSWPERRLKELAGMEVREAQAVTMNRGGF